MKHTQKPLKVFSYSYKFSFIKFTLVYFILIYTLNAGLEKNPKDCESKNCKIETKKSSKIQNTKSSSTLQTSGTKNQNGLNPLESPIKQIHKRISGEESPENRIKKIHLELKEQKFRTETESDFLELKNSNPRKETNKNLPKDSFPLSLDPD